MSMNVQPQLITVMELLTALTIRDPSAVSVAKTTLEMEEHVSQTVRLNSNFSETKPGKKINQFIKFYTFL